MVSHNDDTGFGRQANDLRATLGVGWHFVIPSERMFDKPLANEREIMLPVDAYEDYVRGLLRQVQGVIFFERPGWHPSLLKLCRELGVHSVCAPNWEWFNGNDPKWKLCDLFVCTSNFARSIVERYGYRNIADIGPWPLNINAFESRKISGPARLFIHNAGIVDPQDRKGTLDTIHAFRRVKRSDIRLIMRMQKTIDIPKFSDPRVKVIVGNLENPTDLYRHGDVAIQPSKMEGNGFMVLEPLLCGMPVLTLDYPPMNEYVTDPRMLVKKRWFKRRAFPTAWIKHAHLRLPSIRDLGRKIEWCAENEMAPISEANRRFAEYHYNRDRVRTIWTKALGALTKT